MNKDHARIIKVTFDDKRTHEVARLLRVYDLSPMHLYACRFRTAHQPYHNHQHCYKVALTAVQGASAEGYGWQETRLLFLAGLYHDYNHTGRGDVPDQVNIRRAIKGARRWLSLLPQGLPAEDKQQALWLIAITENSHHTRLKQPWEGVLRDADLLASCGELDDVLWRGALGAELGFPVTAESTAKFLGTQHWETTWGATLAQRYIADLTAAA